MANWQETYEKLRKKKETLDLLSGNGMLIDSAPVNNTKKATTTKTKSKKKKDDEERTWFSKGAFEDGYDIGDISKTILGTTTDLFQDVTQGALGIGEKVIDAGATLLGGTSKLFGADDFADDVRGFVEKDLIDEEAAANRFINESLIGRANKIINGQMPVVNRLDSSGDLIEQNSIFGEKSDSLLQSAGQLGGTIGLQAVGVPWWVTTGTTSFGAEAEQAFKQDATYEEAITSGLVSAGAEVLLEKLSGGISFGGKTLDVGLKSKIAESITNKTLQTLTKFGVDVVGEGTEEVLTEVVSNVGKKLSYEDEKTWSEMLTSEEAMDSYLESFIGGAVLGGGFSAGRLNSSLKTGRDYDTGLSMNEQKVVDSEIAKRTEGQNLTSKQKAKIEAEVREDLEKGYISTDTIESTLGGKTYNQLKSVRDHKTNLETQIKELENKPNAEITVKEMEQLNSLREQLSQSNTNTLESKLQAEMEQNIKSDGYLQRSYQEKAKRSKEFTYEVAETDSEFRKGVLESTKGKLNDTTRSHETAEALVKLSEDRKMQYKFTNTKELQQMKLVPEGKTANGLYVVDKDGKREILVNTDSKKYIEAVLVHETAHDFQTTSPETYTKLQDITKQFAEASGDYARIRSEVTEMYKNVEGVNIEEEVTSRLLEDYLGNKDFISNLTTKEPNIVQKIINEIKYLVKKFTAGSPEARKLVELQHTLEETYKEAYRKTEATETPEGTKYSLTDNRGRKLTKEQADFFKDSKVRDEKGNLVQVYHGSNANFTVFDKNKIGSATGTPLFGKGFYFSTSKSDAKGYSNNAAINDNSTVYRTYLNITNPYKATDNDAGMLNTEELQKQGYDGIEIQVGAKDKNYVVFESNQIKNVDNTNPTENPDIRYSLSEDGKLVDNKGNNITLEASDTGTHGTLMAIHNLTEGKLKGIIELGGFPVPSIAITDPSKTGHSNFGEISVLFDKNTIDPANSKNEVYDRDVWSPTFPTVEYDIDTKVLDKIRKMTKTDYGYDSSNRYLSTVSSKLNNIEDNVNRGGIERTLEDIKNSDAFKYVYLKQTNPDFKEAFKTENYHDKYNNETLQRFLDKYDGKYPLNDIPSSEVDNYTSLMVEAYEEQVRQEYAKYPDLDEDTINSLVNTLTSPLRERFAQKDNFLMAAYKLQKNGANNQIIDTAATNELINESINQQEYEKWVDEIFKDIISTKGIRNDKDLFTPSGNRRSFKSLHEDYNLENIVKYLTKKSTVAGQEGWGSGSNFGTLQAQMSTKFKSIDEIKQTANERLVPTTEEHDLLKTYSDTIYADMEALSEYYKYDTSFYGESFDSAGYALNDFAKYKVQNLTNLKKALDNNNIVSANVPNELLQKVVADVNSLKNLPTDYFEAKPQRAVGLDEAQAIVIPNNVDAEFKQQLQDAGLKYYEYDPNIEGDRQRVINQFDDLKFSLSNESDIAPTSTPNQTAAQDIKLQVEEAIAPLQEEITQLKEELQNITAVDYAPATQEVVEQQSTEAFNTIDDADSPQQVEDFAPTGEQVTPTDSLFDTRDYEEVGSKKVNAYQYDNPEVKPYFQTAAREMLTDLQNSTRGERLIIGDNSQIGDNDYYYSGTKRATTDDIADLLDGMGGKYKYSYADIEKGLRAIIEDNGAENNAVSKRIEFYLDKRLREGYTDIDGYEIPADTEYLDMLRAKGITDYYNNIPLGEAPVKTVNKPVDNVSNSNIAERIAPLRAEAIRPAPDKDSHGYKMIRVKTDAELQAETNEEIAEILAEEPKTEDTRNKRKWAIIKANVLDKGMVFEDVSLKHKNRELMGKWDYTLTSEARGQNVIGNGHYEYDPYSKTTKKVSKSLNEIREQVESTGLTKEFYEYMYHKHNIDRMRLDKTYEIENKPVFGYNVTADQSVQKVRELENLYPDFMLYAQDVYDYLEADRNVLVESGVISEETAQLWKDMYPHYVPIRRAGHTGNAINVPLDTGRTGVNAPIKKATGGNQDILPLFDTMASRTLQTHRAAAKNSFGIELKNTIGTTINSQATNVDEVIDSVDAQEELLQEGKNGQKPTFTVFEDGEKITFEITQDMYDALKPISDSSLLNKTFAIPNNISSFHRGVLTQYNPVFMLTNGIKDAQDILINSQHSAKTYAKVPEAFAQLLSKGYWYQEYMLNGGEHNSYFDSVDNTFKTGNKGIKKILDLPPLKQISQLNDYIERIPRLAEYIASREAGRSVEVSMLDAARVTTNFKAGGNLTKFLNRNGFTFVNASVQGAMQQVRNFREANANGVRGWANLATKFAIAGLPAMILNALLWEDDEEYEELSDYVKQNYYIVAKTDDGTFIRIPKGRTLAVIQEGFEQMKHLITGDDEADLKTFIDLFLTNLAPNNPIENNVLSPIVQVVNNKTWYGEDLVPTRLQNLPAAEQYDESTDSFSRWLGEKTNFSPVKINYLLDQYTGGVGDVVLPMMTPEAKSDADTLGEQLLAPLKSKFTTNATMNNQNVTDFYDKSEELTTNAKKSTATDEDVLRNKYINSVKAEMNELYAEKREIQNSDLPNSEKYNRVLEVQKQINELSKEALNEYKNVDIYSNYATAGDRQYRLTDDGEWQKINDKQLEKQDEVTSSLGITPNDYWSNKEEYDYAYENPSKYALANAIADYSTFREISSELYDIKADKDSEGKSINGSRKEKVFDYINNLDLDFEQRIMLAKLEYPSYDEYNYEIIEYLNEREDISYEQMVSILTELEFTVKKDGTIVWD